MKKFLTDPTQWVYFLITLIVAYGCFKADNIGTIILFALGGIGFILVFNAGLKRSPDYYDEKSKD